MIAAFTTAGSLVDYVDTGLMGLGGFAVTDDGIWLTVPSENDLFYLTP